MLLSFIASIVISLRRVGGVLAFACAAAPFAFGAAGMWVRILGLYAAMHTMCPNNPVPVLPELPQPFYFGSGFAIAALAVHFFCHITKQNRNT
jgi:hypothetical protein